VRKSTGELPHSQLTAGELENTRPPMDEHKKPATERVTGTKTKPRLVSAKVPLSRTNGRRSAHLPSVQGGLLRPGAAECSRHASPFAATVPLSRSVHQMPDEYSPYTWSWHA
jgi:hypothetical protein